MDELEISGKRYISTRRAAKEHKYHSDYIGQLIRGGKVEGQKVGRSWYVVADSLTMYLGKETPPKNMRTQPIVEQIVHEKVMDETREEITEEVPTEPVVEEEQEVVEKIVLKEAPKKVQPKIIEPVVEEVEDGEARHIPVKISQPVTTKKEIPSIKMTRNSLRYIADDAPLYPQLERLEKIKTMPRYEEILEESTVLVEDEPVVIIEKRARPKKNLQQWAIRAGAVVVVGVVAAGAVAVASTLVVSTTTVQGETASAGYAFSVPK